MPQVDEPDTTEIIAAEPMDVPGEERKVNVARYYTVQTVTPTKEYNRLWGTYESFLSNGLLCSTDCFASDKTGTIKPGDVIELPETVTIRQSYRKITKEDREKAKRTGEPVERAIFDWIIF